MEDSIISRIPLFEGLSPEEQEELRAMMTQTTLRRGETLFNEGDSGDRLYILLSGKVKLGHASADGRENLLAVLGPGEIVGELTLFDPGPRSTTATAVAPTELLTLDHNQLMTFVESHPQLAKDMLRALAQRLRRTNTALADLVFSDVPGRVAKALLDLADRFGSPTDDGVHTTSPRRSSPSWWAPRARRSTSRWPSSSPAAGSAWRDGPSRCSTSTDCAVAPAEGPSRVASPPRSAPSTPGRAPVGCRSGDNAPRTLLTTAQTTPRPRSATCGPRTQRDVGTSTRPRQRRAPLRAEDA